MKNLHIPILFLSIMLIAVSCENQKFNDQKIIISGQIKDYRKNNSQKIIAFNFQTLENIKSDIKVAIINSAGDFKVETSIAWPQDFFFEYGGKRFYFICSPGDSLKVSIDNAIWGKKDNDKLSCLTIVGGSARDDNAYVNIFIQRIEKILSQYSSPHIVKAYEARDYKEFVLSKKEEAHRDFKNLLDSLRTTSLFNKWAASYINYKSYNYLLRYHIWHPAYNGIDRTEFSMPDEFYSFLNEINIDDKEVISTYQEGFYNAPQILDTKLS